MIRDFHVEGEHVSECVAVCCSTFQFVAVCYQIMIRYFHIEGEHISACNAACCSAL